MIPITPTAGGERNQRTYELRTSDARGLPRFLGGGERNQRTYELRISDARGLPRFLRWGANEINELTNSASQNSTHANEINELTNSGLLMQGVCHGFCVGGERNQRTYEIRWCFLTTSGAGLRISPLGANEINELTNSASQNSTLTPTSPREFVISLISFVPPAWRLVSDPLETLGSEARSDFTRFGGRVT